VSPSDGIGRRPPVLYGIDLSLAAGTAVLLTGRNGARKTTLLRVASGLITPDCGHVNVYGLCPERSRREFHRRVALLSPGDSGLYARLSVRRHLDLAGRLALMARSERADAVERAIQDFDLRPLADGRVDRLSMGQRQRVRVAMAFLPDPQLVLLDEPGTSLDEPSVAVLNAAVSRLLETRRRCDLVRARRQPLGLRFRSSRTAGLHVLACKSL
jgi:ABC-type multidrug transport system ATPase subunit